jgi:hypothetical protein
MALPRSFSWARPAGRWQSQNLENHRTDQLIERAAMHELIGHVQSQQAMQRGPYSVSNAAGISRKDLLIDASLHEFDAVLEQAAAGCQKSGIALRRRLGRCKDQRVFDGMLEHELPVRIEDRKHLGKRALYSCLALAHELLESLEAKYSDVRQKVFFVLEISIRQRVAQAKRIGESPEADRLQPALPKNRQGNIAKPTAHGVDFGRRQCISSHLFNLHRLFNGVNIYVR